MKPGIWVGRIVCVAAFCVCATLAGALPALAQEKPTGTPVPEDSAIFKAFALLEKQPGYRTTMVMEPSDPKMAQMMKQGMGMTPMETIDKGGVRQVSFHFKLPAMDAPGTIDDWEVRAVAKNGKAARLITSPAVPRILKYSEQMAMMQLAMLEKQSAMAMTQALAQGPMGGISAAFNALNMAMAPAMMEQGLKKEKEMFSWKCEGRMGGQLNDGTNKLTDMKELGEQTVNGKAASAYEFYVRDEGKLQGPIHLLVAKTRDCRCAST